VEERYSADRLVQDCGDDAAVQDSGPALLPFGWAELAEDAFAVVGEFHA
jgi:hypothetical protein